ncbi:DUF11 domain-containing protein [Marinilongibacter aquaticus]|uniref:Ig-like domain-containing protein n=1 Tax=Marinilongibacter aquaticus TaxID=2975157 RepID=UPI0021BD2B2E|nr:gliding motility-associated C-terminal domain-containing protein [Marinilongibacter aquaticus]UBM60489.1 DUF11 domain-containing protein [Marinilongibacter aquaticus]
MLNFSFDKKIFHTLLKRPQNGGVKIPRAWRTTHFGALVILGFFCMSFLADNQSQTAANRTKVFADSCNLQISISADQSVLCAGSSVKLVASSDSALTINWYASAVSDSVLFSSESGDTITVSPSSTTVYYAALADSSKACDSTRQSIEITVLAVPDKPNVIASTSVCKDSTVNLDSLILSNTGNFVWYTANDIASALVEHPDSVGPGTYYVFAVNDSSCYSSSSVVSVSEALCDSAQISLIDLSLIKIADRRIVHMQDSVQYSIEIHNAGPDTATNVSIRDDFPEGLTFISSKDFTHSNNTLNALLDAIPAGESRTLTYWAQVVKNEGPIVNVAEIESVDQEDIDSTPGNAGAQNEDDDDDEILNIIPEDAKADLSVQKLVNDFNPLFGDFVTYTVKISNSGPAVATGVKVEDQLPEGLKDISTMGISDVAINGNTLIASIDSLEINKTIEWQIKARVNNLGELTNKAQIIASDLPDPDSTPNNNIDEDDSDQVEIQVEDNCNPPTPVASVENTFICIGDSTILSAIGCPGTVEWSNGETGNAITITPEINGIYTARCRIGTCLSPASNTILVTVRNISSPTVAVSKSFVCPGDTVTLEASACAGTVTWSSGATGKIIKVSPSENTSYSAICSIGGCSSQSSSPILIRAGVSPPTIQATSLLVCKGQSVTLTASGCDGEIVWSNGLKGPQIAVAPVIISTYTAKCKYEKCESASSENLTIYIGSSLNPTIVASQDSLCSGSTVDLKAENCVGDVLWNTGESTLSISKTLDSTQTYTVTCGNATCSGTASKTILVFDNAAPRISASSLFFCTADTIQLHATGCSSGTVLWSNGKQGATIKEVVNSSRNYTAKCKLGSCESASSNTVQVTFGDLQKPTISSTGTLVCAGSSVTLNSTSCVGSILWSNGQTGDSITVSPAAKTVYTAICKTAKCESAVSNAIEINKVNVVPAPTLSSNTTQICNQSAVSLFASNCGGKVIWSNGATGTTLTVNPDTTTTYTAKCLVGTCESVDSSPLTITFGQPDAPLVSAEKDSICLGSSVNLTASGCSGKLKWSNGMEGASITVSPEESTSYRAICTIGAVCQSDSSASISIHVIASTPLSKPITQALINVCPDSTVNLAYGVLNGLSNNANKFVFKSVNSLEAPILTNTSAVNASGMYYAFEQSPNGCLSESSQIDVSIIPCLDTLDCVASPATANAGVDQTVCITNDFFMLLGSIGGSAQAATWTSLGSGSFENSTALNAKYYPSIADIQNGEVRFVLSTNDPDGPGTTCQAARDTVLFTINGVPVQPTIAIVSGSSDFCLGDSLRLSVSDTASSYLWNNAKTTKSISVKNSGTYFVQLVDSNGCRSLSSNKITVEANSPLSPPPLTSNTASNTCPALTVNLNDYVQQDSISGQLEFRTSPNLDSPILADPTAVGTGFYYIFEKSAEGCYSDPAQITVTIEDCDSLQSDVSILLTGDKTSAAFGESIQYKVLVKNHGPEAAHNVYVEIKVPSALNLKAFDDAFTLENGFLSSRISQISVGDSVILSFDGLISSAEGVSTTANILALDEIDQFPDNNSSTFHVVCAQCQEVCLANALQAIAVEKADSTYDIHFTSLIENCGNTELSHVRLKLDLHEMFGDSTNFTLVSAPVSSSSSLQVNPAYNGGSDIELLIADSSTLNMHVIDTLNWTINLVPDGNFGPFSGNALVTAEFANSILSDVSNDGLYIEAAKATPTVVKLYDSPALGLSLAIVDTNYQDNSTLLVTYQMIAKNKGQVDLSHVILSDSLSKTYFDPVQFSLVGSPSLDSNSTLQLNPAFNGKNASNLTTSASTLAVGQTDTLRFTIQIDPKSKTEFSNQAYASAKGTVSVGGTETVVEISNDGQNPDAPGRAPTLLDLKMEEPVEGDACIGLAFYTDQVDSLGNQIYAVTYKAILRNCGDVALTNFSLCEPENLGFDSTAIVSLSVSPKVNAGSTLVVDDSFDAHTHLCLLDSSSVLKPNRTDTLTWTVNVTLGSNGGPFSRNLEVIAQTPKGESVSDISNEGNNPSPIGSLPTVTRFNAQNSKAIGLAKKLVSIESTDSTKVYDLVFEFVLKNYGDYDIDSLRLQDDLSDIFSDLAIIDSTAIFNLSDGLAANTNYTGNTGQIDLLEPSSTLPRFSTKRLSLFARIDLADANGLQFENMAIAIGLVDSTTIDDLSNDGVNPDPDNDGIPTNNSMPTPMDFSTKADTSFVTALGIAKEVVDTVAIIDGSYQVSYAVVLKNYGDSRLSQIQLVDSLSSIFKDSTQFAVIGNIETSTNSTLYPEPTFNGSSVRTMLVDSSYLDAGQSDTLRFVVKVRNNGMLARTYYNTIYGAAVMGSSAVIDLSQEGLDPDPDDDNNPGNNNTPTPVILKNGKNESGGSVFVSMPGGLSPNGDGKNDVFFIEGIAEEDEVNFKVFDRWGQLVFESENYKADFPGEGNGWDGRSNKGIGLEKNPKKLPNGTYYVVLESKNNNLFQGKPYINFITIYGAGN